MAHTVHGPHVREKIGPSSRRKGEKKKEKQIGKDAHVARCYIFFLHGRNVDIHIHAHTLTHINI